MNSEHHLSFGISLLAAVEVGQLLLCAEDCCHCFCDVGYYFLFSILYLFGI